VELKNWSHPTDAVKIIEGKENNERTIQLYTNGSKSEHGVGSGVAIFAGNELAAQLKFNLDKKSSNNRAEQLAILKALQATETLDITKNGTLTAAIFTNSRIAIDTLENIKNHNFLIEEIRKKVFILETTNWTIEFSWLKAHVGTFGNELDYQLTKEAARNRDATISNKIPKGTLISEIEEESIKNGTKNGVDVRREK